MIYSPTSPLLIIFSIVGFLSLFLCGKKKEKKRKHSFVLTRYKGRRYEDMKSFVAVEVN